jgi:hypothetical protein
MNLKKFLGDLISFNTPRAIVFNLGLILIILAIIPTDKLHYLPIRSVYENIFRFTPYSSGMTRALSSLLHGDISSAWNYNKLVFVVLATIIILIITNINRSVNSSK